MNHQIQCLSPGRLEQFLERRRRDFDDTLAAESSLAENLVEILRRANEFVPSDAGSILLDDPTVKVADRSENKLTFLAAFGDKVEDLAGREIGASKGIAGRVYLTGEPYRADEASTDRFFHDKIDEAIEFKTRALVAVPIRLGDEVCGVLELIRERPYTETEANLLHIFAGYLSVSIQNVLDTRHALKIAKRDGLTGLFNDRYLHIAIADLLDECDAQNSDLNVMFLDLDYFKSVNDRHGHLAGSQVLNEVGELLEEASQGRGAVPCRYGGDEFVVLLPHAELASTEVLGEEVRTMIGQMVFCDKPGKIQRDPLHLTGLSASIGIASWRQHLKGKTAEQARTALLHIADAAMYIAKESGRNKVVVADSSSILTTGSALATGPIRIVSSPPRGS